MSDSARVGVDTGGTFTDFVFIDSDGLRVLKLPSLPEDPARVVLEGVHALAGDRPVEVAHSTTVATNALLQRRGGPTLLVTTAGFEDVLVLGRQARPSLYALHPVVPAPLVADEMRLGIAERMDAHGQPLEVPSSEELHELVERVRALAPASIAVCLLHAYANPAHEQLVAAAMAPLAIPISLSSQVLPLPREWERTVTTVTDAYIKPVVAPYLARLGASGRRLRVLQSNGGAIPADEAAARPVGTLLSGPAAGVTGALRVVRAAGISHAITFDMGGTSTDVALISDGEVELCDEGEIAGQVLALPMMAIHTVGAGGGSLAFIDAGGALKVGPRSAGALPGPACYGKGGEAATVTDANLLIGRLSARHFLGGAMVLDEARARAAMQPLADALGATVEDSAEAVVAVADAVMARAIKRVSVEQGVDPARCTLVPFGGAGAMHACAVARELGIGSVLVPPSPGLLCAYGALAADSVHELITTHLMTLPARFAAAELDAQFAALESRAQALLDADQIEPARRLLRRRCTLRYLGQSFELEVPASGDLAAAFHAAHEVRWGHALADRPVELCSLRLRAVGTAPKIELPRESQGSGDPLIGRGTTIHGGRAFGAALYARGRLQEGQILEGPALITEYSATTFLPPGTQAHVLPGGALQISL